MAYSRCAGPALRCLIAAVPLVMLLGLAACSFRDPHSISTTPGPHVTAQEVDLQIASFDQTSDGLSFVATIRNDTDQEVAFPITHGLLTGLSVTAGPQTVVAHAQSSDPQDPITVAAHQTRNVAGTCTFSPSQAAETIPWSLQLRMLQTGGTTITVRVTVPGR